MKFIFFISPSKLIVPHLFLYKLFLFVSYTWYLGTNANDLLAQFDRQTFFEDVSYAFILYSEQIVENSGSNTDMQKAQHFLLYI